MMRSDACLSSTFFRAFSSGLLATLLAATLTTTARTQEAGSEPSPPSAPVPAEAAYDEQKPEAQPDAPLPLRITGSFFHRYELREGYDELGVSRNRFTEGDAAFYRARLGIDTTPLDIGNDHAVSMQFTPQASGVVGAVSGQLTDANLGLL